MMMHTPLISILIPVYNAEKYISNCLDSIVSQPKFDSRIEILLLNDGSKDNTLDIINEYSNRYKNIRIISRENKGIGPTRNELIDSAYGEYFWFIDADDYINSDSLELILGALLEDNYDMLMLSYEIKHRDSDETITYLYKGCYDSGYSITDRDIYNNSVWTRVYRKSLVTESGVRFQNFIMGEDFDFIFRLIPYLGKVKCIDTVIYYYVMTPNSACSNQTYEHRYKVSEDSLTCLLSYSNLLHAKSITEQNILRKALNLFLIGYVYSVCQYGLFSIDYKQSVVKKLRDADILPVRPLPEKRSRRLYSLLINNSFLLKLYIYLFSFLKGKE